MLLSIAQLCSCVFSTSLCHDVTLLVTAFLHKDFPFMADPNNIFLKIARREIPADIVFEDEQCVAFRDINPQAPVHILVIPRKPLESISEATTEDKELLGHLLLVAGQIAQTTGIAQTGYRVVVNTGRNAGQTVFQLHVHVLGGRDLGWPPG